MDLYLASASPRRIELLKALGLVFTSLSADADETRLPGEPPRDHVLRLAAAKAEIILSRVSLENPRALVLGADTIVLTDDGKILGKPKDPLEARKMLDLLSGAWHSVLTGFAVVSLKTKKSGLVKTRVSFRSLTEAEKELWLACGEGLDKAGGYAVQGAFGPLLVDRVEGSYSNIIGLPVKETLSLVYEVAGEL
ncbi:MAG: Maf family protein [Deltaproteobacteria bacterium]|jgi:septum formation protein|nr:Maf family protein [Deltaproteobacteria bacterium]